MIGTQMIDRQRYTQLNYVELRKTMILNYDEQCVIVTKNKKLEINIIRLN